MAGTGHGYEIANISDVRTAIAGLVEMAQRDPVAVAWLSGRSFLRYATSEPFVFKVRKNSSRAFLEAVPEPEREFIVRKLDAGGDVRIFSSAEFQRGGPDVPHILDWMADLRETRPQDHAKIPRMAAEDLIRKVSSWIKPRARRSVLPEGSLRHVLQTEDGYTWVELLDRAALLAEGDAMAHCVDKAVYGRALLDGEIRILSMRSPDGLRLLTMELSRGSPASPLTITQIQAFANQTPPEGAIRSICDVLNHLGVTPRGSDQERRARIAHVKGQGWQSIYQTWKRIEIDGIECITDGRELLFMSPVHPDRPLVNVTSAIPNAFRSLGGELSVPLADGYNHVRLADERHFSIDELRAAAKVAVAFNARIDHPAFDHTSETVCIPYMDTLVEQQADGHLFLRDPHAGNAYVTHSDDRALILLEIGRYPRFFKPREAYTSSQATAYNIARWKEADVLRCLSVMTSMGCKAFGTPAEELRPITAKYEPVLTEDGQWRPFLLDAVRHDSRKPSIQWLETPYRLAMCVNGRQHVQFEIHEGRLLSLPYTWMNGHDCGEMAARLNRLRIVPADDVWCPRIGSRLSPTKKPGVEYLVCIRGRWKVARSQRDVIRLAGTGEGLTRGEARLLLHSLPGDAELRLRETDRLYMSCMARGVLSGTDVRMPYSDDRKPFLWFYDNLHLLPPSDHKVAVRCASRILDDWSRRTKCLLARMEDEIRLFFAVRTHLKESVVARVIRHVFKKNRYWLGAHASDIKWVTEIFPALSDEKLRAAVFHGIERGAGASSSVADPDILLVNVACLLAYARHDHILLDFKLEANEAAYQRLLAAEVDSGKQKVMTDIRHMLDSLPTVIAERQAEIDARRRKWDELFHRSSGNRPLQEAA